MRNYTIAATALALTFSLAACSNEENQAEEPTTAETTTSTAEASNDTVELTTQDGTKVLVPAKAANATETLGLRDWGEPVTVESRQDGTTLISYDGGQNIVYNPETGPVALVGEIARVWKEHGGLDAEIGVPTGAEKKLEDGTGWTQEFQHGTIEWVQENGSFVERVS